MVDSLVAKYPGNFPEETVLNIVKLHHIFTLKLTASKAICPLVRTLRAISRNIASTLTLQRQEICIQPAPPSSNRPYNTSGDPDLILSRFRAAFDPICFKIGSELDQKRLKIGESSGLFRKGGCFKLGLDLAGPDISTPTCVFFC